VADPEPKEISWSGEILRKLTHLFALVIPLGYYYLDLTRWQALAILVPISIFIITVDFSRLGGWPLWRLFRPLIAPMVRRDELTGNFTGATYILATACLTIALFARPVAVLALTFIITGDPASAMIGRRFGRHRLKNKSLEGSLAFLSVALLVALIIPEVPLVIGLTGAVVATVTEGLSFRVDDNASVPLLSGLYMTLCWRILEFWQMG